MEKLQGLIETLDMTNHCVVQCYIEKCGNTTVHYYSDEFSNGDPDQIVSNCEKCNKDVCWDHCDSDADVIICHDCSSDYWKSRYNEINTKYEKLDSLMDNIRDKQTCPRCKETNFIESD